jgi:hypothetical protein
VPLVRADRGDAQQLTSPVRSRCELGGVDPGLGHVNLVRRQRIATQQPFTGRPAGADDVLGGAQNRGFARLRVRHRITGRRFTEGDVNENGQAEPARFRDQDAGHR